MKSGNIFDHFNSFLVQSMGSSASFPAFSVPPPNYRPLGYGLPLQQQSGVLPTYAEMVRMSPKLTEDMLPGAPTRTVRSQRKVRFM